MWDEVEVKKTKILFRLCMVLLATNFIMILCFAALANEYMNSNEQEIRTQLENCSDLLVKCQVDCNNFNKEPVFDLPDDIVFEGLS